MALADYATSTSNPHIQRIDFNTVFSQGSEADKADASRLLTRIHEGIYSTTFPIPSEQEALGDWLDRLNATEEPTNIQFFSVYGKNLGEPEKADIAGFVVSEYYKGTDLGLINYVIRDKAYHDMFPAKEMVDHHVETMKKAAWDRDRVSLKAPLWEANDPRKMLLSAIEESELFTPDEKEQYSEPALRAIEGGVDMDVSERKMIEGVFRELHGKEYWEDTDCMDPSKRISHIENNFGAKRVGISYAQAPLEEYDTLAEREEMTCDDLFLYVYDASSYPDFKPEHLKNYSNVFASTFAGAEAKELGVESLGRMVNQLELMESQKIPLMTHQQTPEQQRKILAISATPDTDADDGAPIARRNTNPPVLEV